MEEEFEARKEFVQILRQFPAEWNKYVRRQRQVAQVAQQTESRLITPQGQRGAPRKVERAEEAKAMRHRGMKYPQIAAEMNKRHSENGNTPESIRQLLKRHGTRTKSQPEFRTEQ